jgi:hypothetical protein
MADEPSFLGRKPAAGQTEEITYPIFKVPGLADFGDASDKTGTTGCYACNRTKCAVKMVVVP